MMQHTVPSAPTDQAARSPFAFDRFCDELRNQAARLGTTLIDVRHRLIADAIGCSAARIHEFMQRLEDRGQIVREPFKNRFLIDVSPLIDQGDRSGVIDQGRADSGVIDQGDRSGSEDNSSKTIRVIDQGDRSGGANQDITQQSAESAQNSGKRVKNGCMVHDQVVVVDSETTTTGSSRAGATAVLVDLGADVSMRAKIFAAQPDITPEEILAQAEIAKGEQEAGKTPSWRQLLFGTLKKPGGRLYGRAAPDQAVDWGAYAQIAPPGESPQQRARRILPDGASNHDFVFLVQQLASGATDADALAALAERQKRGRR